MPDFDDDVQLDTSQIEDLRGSGGGGGGMPMGRVAGGGGVVALVVVVVGLLLGVDVTGGGTTSGLGPLGELVGEPLQLVQAVHLYSTEKRMAGLLGLSPSVTTSTSPEGVRQIPSSLTFWSTGRSCNTVPEASITPMAEPAMAPSS